MKEKRLWFWRNVSYDKVKPECDDCGETTEFMYFRDHKTEIKTDKIACSKCYDKKYAETAIDNPNNGY